MNDTLAKRPPAAGADPHLEGRVTAKTLDHYKRAAARMVPRCQQHHARPWTPDEWDDRLMEFKLSARKELGKSGLIATASAAQFRFPRLKGKLACSRAATRGRNIAASARHAVPMTSRPSKWIAVQMAN